MIMQKPLVKDTHAYFLLIGGRKRPMREITEGREEYSRRDIAPAKMFEESYSPNVFIIRLTKPLFKRATVRPA